MKNVLPDVFVTPAPESEPIIVVKEEEEGAEAELETPQHTDLPSSKVREKVYLIDMDNVPNTLQNVIEKEDMECTMVYCFCGSKSPKISLGLLNEYSRWVSAQRLKVIETHSTCKRPTDYMIAFWAGKLAERRSKEEIRFFVASDNYGLQAVVEGLRADGFEIQTSWPSAEVVECTDDMMYTVLHVLDSAAPERLPGTLDQLQTVLAEHFNLPPYISVQSVIRKLVEHDFITIHKGNVSYAFPVFLDKHLNAQEQQAFISGTHAASHTHTAQEGRRRVPPTREESKATRQQKTRHHPAGFR